MISRIYAHKSPGLDLVAFANSSLEDLEIQRMLHQCTGTFGLSIFQYLDICQEIKSFECSGKNILGLSIFQYLDICQEI